MGVLQAFERRLGGLVEGAFAKVFKGDVQPAEIAGALQREADNEKNVVAAGRVLVPNEYVVALGSHDYARIEEWAEPLGAELATMVKEHAAESGYSFVGAVKVTFEQQPSISTGVFRVRSSVVSSAGGAAPVSASAAPVVVAPAAPPVMPVAPAPVTNPVVTPVAAPRGPRPAPPGALPRRPRLIVSLGGDEEAHFLTHSVTVIGRSAEADLRLDDSGVSRRHAELRYASGAVELIDLGSTNGVSVNGKPIGRAPLADGDRLDIASTTLIYRVDED